MAKSFLVQVPGQVDVVSCCLDHRLQRVRHHLVKRRRPHLFIFPAIACLARKDNLRGRNRSRQRRLDRLLGPELLRQVNLINGYRFLNLNRFWFRFFEASQLGSERDGGVRPSIVQLERLARQLQVRLVEQVGHSDGTRR